MGEVIKLPLIEDEKPLKGNLVMKKISLFDTLISKTNLTIEKEEDLEKTYKVLTSVVVQPMSNLRPRYKELPNCLDSTQKRDLVAEAYSSFDVIMWNQFLQMMYKKNVSQTAAVALAKDFGIKVEDFEIFKYIPFVDKNEIANLQNLNGPYNLKEMQEKVLETYKKHEKMVEAFTKKKLSFLANKNKQNMVDIINDVKVAYLAKVEIFLVYYQGNDLGKMLNSSMKNYITNYVNSKVSKKRNNFTLVKDENGIKSSVYNLVSTTIEVDGEETDLLNTLDTGASSTEYKRIEIKNSCKGLLKSYKPSVNQKNSQVIVEVMKILSNENPEYVTWYNNKENTNFETPSDIAEEKNFLKSISDYCNVSPSKLNGILGNLKGKFMEVLED